MLLWAIVGDNPYGYYVLLRIVCCGIFALLAFLTIDRGQHQAWAFGLTAVVYNPVIRIHLTRDIWEVINWATIALAGASVLVLSPSFRKKLFEFIFGSPS